MNIIELHEELSKQIKKGNGDLPVVLECNHGETPMHSSWSGLDKVVDASEYMMESVDTDDPDYEHDGDLVYLIQAY